jgi:hypothetical protein
MITVSAAPPDQAVCLPSYCVDLADEERLCPRYVAGSILIFVLAVRIVRESGRPIAEVAREWVCSAKFL